MQWSALSLVAILGVLTAGCGKGVFCGKCGPPKPPPTEIVWDGLAEELEEVNFGNVTVNVKSATVAVEPGEDGWKIQVTNWQELVAELRKTEAWRAKQVEHYALMHRLHTMLAEQKPPVTQNFWLLGSTGSTPVLGQCPADLSVFVVFSREAQFEDWSANYYNGCPPVKCPEESDRSCEEIGAPVCPNRAMYEEQIGSYLANLGKCEGGQRTLRVRGFASSSGISRKLDAEEFQRMQGDFGKLGASCDNVAIDPLQADTQMFNLLVSSIRAHNVAELLRAMGEDRGITIEEEPWCSYERMKSEPPRIIDNKGGTYDSLAGMWNRRAEIRVVQ